MSRRLALPLLAALSSLGLAAPVLAQYTPGSFMYFDHLANNFAVNIGMIGQTVNASDDDDEVAPKVQPKRQVRLDFTPSKVVRQKTITTVIDAIGQLNPAQRNELRAAFVNNDLFSQAETALRPYNVRTNNVADAMTVYLISAWDAAHGVSDQASVGKFAAVRSQIADGLSQNQAIGGLSDATKQELSDTLFINAFLIDAMADSAKENPSIAANVRRSAMEGATVFGFDLSKIQIGENGIRTVG